jgi:eukaryotic-like serine/threonine-protein kinase
MPISTGMRLGPYEVRERVGAGGMGEVYKAHDSRLERDVAIKISAERFTERFEHEARAIAALNHPHICTLYDIGPNYLVMEYIEGLTLSQRIRAGAIPLEEALPIARQVAEALESAHEKGIIHRDLKPANIKLTPEGNVKVLDFGLAAIRQGCVHTASAAADSPTLTLSGAKPGVILGTAGYMSPEQVRGLPVDKRADMWAYGVVLYEMLTGRQLFRGETISDKLAAALKDGPDWNALPPETPVAIRRLLRRCMERDRKNRLQDIGDARLEIDEALAAQEDTRPMGPLRSRNVWIGISITSAVLALGVATLHFREAQPPEIVTALSVLPPENAINVNRVSVSPDGRSLAFVAATKTSRPRIYLRSLDTPTLRPLNGTENAGNPFWSPDGRFLAFTVTPGNKLVKVPVAGGPPQTLCESDVLAAGTWSAMGTILIGRLGDGLFRVSASNGTVTRLTTPDASRDERRHLSPYFLPGGRQFLYVAASDKPGKSMLYAASLDSAKRTPIMPVESNVSFVSSRRESTRGYLLFLREGALLAQPFDVRQLRTTGDSFALAEHVGSRGITGSPLRHAYFSASDSTLAYWQDTARSQQLAWFSRSGQRLGIVGRPWELGGVVLSPDGHHVAAVIGDADVQSADLWLIDVQRGTSLPLTFERGLGDGQPVFSRDGTRVAFSARRGGVSTISQKSTSGTGAEEKLLESNNRIRLSDWSRDGKFLAYTVFPLLNSQSTDIWILPLAGDRKPFPFLNTPASESAPQFSPDGKWIAYTSDEGRAAGGRPSQVYIQPFAPESTNSTKRQISVNGGRAPRWRDDGKELFYFEGRKLMAAEIRTSGRDFEASIPKELFEPPESARSAGFPTFAVSPDGQRFLLPEQVESEAAMPITLLLNWTAGIQK